MLKVLIEELLNFEEKEECILHFEKSKKDFKFTLKYKDKNKFSVEKNAEIKVNNIEAIQIIIEDLKQILITKKK